MSLIIQDIVIPESSAECSEWIAYFSKLQKKFGDQNARVIWLKTWAVNGSTSCTTKSDFNAFLKKHQIDVSNMATAAIAGISDLGGDILGMGKGITKILTYGVPVVLALVIGTILYSIVRVTKNATPADILKLTPEGQVAALLKK